MSTHKPRIALIRQKYTNFGGAERFAAAALAALIERGARLAVVARAWQHQPGVEIIKVDPFHIGRLWRDRSFAKAACNVIAQREFDLVQSHERLTCCDIYRAGDGVHAEWLRQRARILSPIGRVLQFLSPYHRYVRKAERALFTSGRLRAVICNSDMVRQEIIERFGEIDARIEIVYNAVDLERFSPLLRSRFRQSMLTELQLPERSLVYLFVGSGYARKGLAQALRALSQMPLHCYLVVVGKDRRLRRYRQLARRIGVEARVRFVGAVDDTTPYYGCADVFVLPTLYDPFPNVILEAMACALPVITSRKCGAVDLLRDGENGFVCDALDVDGLAWRMRELLDARAREKLGFAARNLLEGWNAALMADRLLSLYRDVLIRE
ncbi:glycosyltransferase family 4 protein [Acidihalobacter ferrooxydans]|uniref:Glycosyltransferase subfamily 4-like N-terminal domain-containing protein n=1 Tax=Acidihalobacter ferrooxydans TaxID=1765967 RepID=A0A1P8UI68_9GAMM|nr:glycosyltransferase family 4 protein [Acidihalobacter ferrooxydans]APZ43535.1 hypothetical protein BW247_10920 [Acidihalobacter ferrooxydans]